MGDPVIRITLNGRQALTVDMISDATGLNRESVRTTLRRVGVTAAGHLNAMTPLYLAAPTLKALKARPGRWPKTDT